MSDKRTETGSEQNQGPRSTGVILKELLENLEGKEFGFNQFVELVDEFRDLSEEEINGFLEKITEIIEEFGKDFQNNLLEKVSKMFTEGENAFKEYELLILTKLGLILEGENINNINVQQLLSNKLLGQVMLALKVVLAEKGLEDIYEKLNRTKTTLIDCKNRNDVNKNGVGELLVEYSLLDTSKKRLEYLDVISELYDLPKTARLFLFMLINDFEKTYLTSNLDDENFIKAYEMFVKIEVLENNHIIKKVLEVAEEQPYLYESGLDQSKLALDYMNLEEERYKPLETKIIEILNRMIEENNILSANNLSSIKIQSIKFLFKNKRSGGFLSVGYIAEITEFNILVTSGEGEDKKEERKQLELFNWDLEELLANIDDEEKLLQVKDKSEEGCSLKSDLKIVIKEL